MQLVICSNPDLTEEWLAQGTGEGADIEWIKHPEEFNVHKGADGYIDLLFNPTPDRMALLSGLEAPVIVNSVAFTRAETASQFIRINGWKSLLIAETVEASAPEELQKEGERIFSFFGKQPDWLPDTPGFVTPRVISAIINEAYFALAEGVSTKEEINTAMKLGTNHPYGPFDWAEKIGKGTVAFLLQKLSEGKSRYAPCPLLLQEATI